MIFTKKVLSLFIVILLLVTTVACSSQSASDTSKQETKKLSGTLRIGAAFAKTGAYATASQDMLKSLKFAIQEVNNSGLLGDAKFELVEVDAGSTPETAINAFQRLINQEKVKIIIGPVTPAQANAAGPLAQQAKVLTLGALYAGTTKVGDYSIDMLPDISTMIPGVVDEVVKVRNIKTAALITPKDYPTGLESQPFRRDKLNELGVQIVLDEQTMLADTDFTALISKIMKVNPDMIVLDGTLPHDPMVLNQLKRAGYKGTIMVGSGTSLTTIKTDPQAYESVVGMVPWKPGTDGENEVSQKFSSDYQQSIGYPPEFLAAAYYDNLFILANAVKNVGNFDDIEEIRKQFLTTEINGVIGKVKYDSNRTFVTGDGVVVQVKNGDYVNFEK